MQNNRNKVIYVVCSILIVVLLCLILIDNDGKVKKDIVEMVLIDSTLDIDAGEYGNNGYHAKVVYFKDGWNGYKYWMAFTPYPHAQAIYENPSINVSNNMIDWKTPKGLTNPIDAPDHADKIHYNSDTHLLYNDDEDRLEMFWRYVDDETKILTIYTSYSYDGINWSDKEEFMVSNDRNKQDFLSPVVEYNDGTYEIWYVFNRKVFYVEKTQDHFSEPRALDLEYEKELYSWHIDVIKHDGIYEISAVSYEDVNNRREMSLYYAFSEDNVKWTKMKTLLEPSDIEEWYIQGLYRPALLYKDDKYYLFFSWHDEVYNVGVGLLCGDRLDKLDKCSLRK